jgi:hypothetical protein
MAREPAGPLRGSLDGERGRNRVRAFVHPKTGGLFLEFADGGTRKRMALGHRDRGAAKAKAEELAAALRRGGVPPTHGPHARHAL